MGQSSLHQDLRYCTAQLPEGAFLLTKNFPHPPAPIRTINGQNKSFLRGLKYQAWVEAKLEREWGMAHFPGLWFMYWKGDKKRHVQFDSLIVDLSGGIFYIVECKYRHTFIAYQQLFNYYVPVLEAALRSASRSGAYAHHSMLADDREVRGLRGGSLLRSGQAPLNGAPSLASQGHGSQGHGSRRVEAGFIGPNSLRWTIKAIEVVNQLSPEDDERCSRSGAVPHYVKRIEDAIAGRLNVWHLPHNGMNYTGTSSNYRHPHSSYREAGHEIVL
jgi:hypothetical protein